MASIWICAGEYLNKRYNNTEGGGQSISFGYPYARTTGRTCGGPGEIKNSKHPPPGKYYSLFYMMYVHIVPLELVHRHGALLHVSVVFVAEKER